MKSLFLPLFLCYNSFMAFRIERNDITKVRADAIVNTANPRPVVGAGTDTAVYEAAGMKDLLVARLDIGEIPRGQARETDSFALKEHGVKYIIHTVGVWYEGGKSGEEEILRNCYRNSLALAAKLGCKSLAIPLLSSGTYSFPKELALRVALDEINAFLLEHEMDVILVVYDDESNIVSKKLFDDIEDFLHENLEGEGENKQDERGASSDDKGLSDRKAEAGKLTGRMPGSVDAFLAETKPQKNFSDTLLQMIADRGLGNADVYKKAFMDNKSFSKLINRKDQLHISPKEAVLALGLALRLPIDEYKNFLALAGHVLVPSSRRELIIEYCVTKGYDIDKTNALLFDCGEKCFWEDRDEKNPES